MWEVWAAERAEMERIYQSVDEAWDEAGLVGRGVVDTPGWEMAVEAVRNYCATIGYTWPLSGPITRDTWSHWVHILSHIVSSCVGEKRRGHSVSHAKLELRLSEVAIAELRTAANTIGRNQRVSENK